MNTADVSDLTLSAFLLQQIKTSSSGDADNLRELHTLVDRLGLGEQKPALNGAAQ